MTTKRFAASAVVASLALAACGGDDDETDTSEASESTDAAETESTDAAETESTDAAETESTDAAETESTEAGGDTTASADIDYGSLSGNLVGAGASSQAAGMQGWQAGFAELAPNVSVAYDPIGSGGGRETFLSGGTNFAGSDAALDADEYEASKEVCAGDQGAVNLPHYISPIAIPYNLPSLEGSTLNLTPAAIAGIFANEITNWNDPAIADANPDLELPDLNINPVHRSDESGTTENFTDYMSANAPDVWTYGAIEAWDGDGPGGGEGGDGTTGVVAAVGQGEGSIGYADASQIGDLPAAAVEVAGEFVEYSAEAAGRIVDSSERTGGQSEYDFAIQVNRTPDSADTYPIALVSYHIVCMEYDSAETAELVKAFMTYVGSAEGQEAAALTAGAAPISDEVRAEILVTIDAITGG